VKIISEHHFLRGITQPNGWSANTAVAPAVFAGRPQPPRARIEQRRHPHVLGDERGFEVRIAVLRTTASNSLVQDDVEVGAELRSKASKKLKPGDAGGRQPRGRLSRTFSANQIMNAAITRRISLVIVI